MTMAVLYLEVEVEEVPCLLAADMLLSFFLFSTFCNLACYAKLWRRRLLYSGHCLRLLLFDVH